MTLHFANEAQAAVKLAFNLSHMDRDSIITCLESLGDQIVAAHEGLGITRAEAVGLARRFCETTFDQVIRMRGDPQAMH